MKVLLISDEFPPRGGGAGTVARKLAIDLLSLQADVTLVSGGGNSESVEGVTQLRVERKTLLWPFAYRDLFRSLDLGDFDLVVLNDFVAAYIAGRYFSMNVLARCIVIIHGSNSRFVYQQSTNKHRIFRYRKWYTRLISNCKHILAVSDYAARLFSDNVPPELSLSPVTYHYTGIDPSDFDMATTISKEEIGLPAHAFVLFTACRLVSSKGIFEQLGVFARLAEEMSDVYWVIAGWGQDKSLLENEIERAGLSERVRLVGKLQRRALGAYYRMADVFWMLSPQETLGLVYLEANLFGTPSIGREVSGVREAIAPGKSGFFYNPDTILDQIQYCRANDMSGTCTEHAQTFASSKFADRVLEFAR